MTNSRRGTYPAAPRTPSHPDCRTPNRRGTMIPMSDDDRLAKIEAVASPRWDLDAIRAGALICLVLAIPFTVLGLVSDGARVISFFGAVVGFVDRLRWCGVGATVRHTAEPRTGHGDRHLRRCPRRVRRHSAWSPGARSTGSACSSHCRSFPSPASSAASSGAGSRPRASSRVHGDEPASHSDRSIPVPRTDDGEPLVRSCNHDRTNPVLTAVRALESLRCLPGWKAPVA